MSKKQTKLLINNSNERKNLLKLNNIFRAENVKDISDQIHRFGKYAGNDYEFDESIHYEPGKYRSCLSNQVWV